MRRLFPALVIVLTVCSVSRSQPPLVTKMLAGNWTVRKLSNSINSAELTYAPFITDDGSTMFFVARRPSGLPDKNFDNVFVTSRDSPNDSMWTPPEFFDILNSGEANGPVVRDSMGEFFLASSRPSVTGSDMNIWFGAIRGKRLHLSPLNAPINTKYWETQPSISYDGRTLLFASNRPFEGKIDPSRVRIYITHRTGDSTWTDPVAMCSKINDGERMGWPHLSLDSRILMFTSDKQKKGLSQLYVTYRTGDTDSSWAEPALLPSPINSGMQELCPFLSPSGEILFFASGRNRDGKGFDLYEARLPGAVWSR